MSDIYDFEELAKYKGEKRRNTPLPIRTATEDNDLVLNGLGEWVRQKKYTMERLQMLIRDIVQFADLEDGIFTHTQDDYASFLMSASPEYVRTGTRYRMYKIVKNDMHYEIEFIICDASRVNTMKLDTLLCVIDDNRRFTFPCLTRYNKDGSTDLYFPMEKVFKDLETCPEDLARVYRESSSLDDRSGPRTIFVNELRRANPKITAGELINRCTFFEPLFDVARKQWHLCDIKVCGTQPIIIPLNPMIDGMGFSYDGSRFMFCQYLKEVDYSREEIFCVDLIADKKVVLEGIKDYFDKYTERRAYVYIPISKRHVLRFNSPDEIDAEKLEEFAQKKYSANEIKALRHGLGTYKNHYLEE